MRRQIVRIAALFAALLLLFTSTACSDGKRLTVTIPTGRVRISPGEIDAEAFRWVNSDLGRYDRYHVSLRSEELFISDKDEVEDTYVYMVRCAGGEFVGLDRGEFDGWVVYVPYDRNYHDEKAEMVVEENCCGFYRYDEKSILVFTGLAHGGLNYGKIYSLQKTGDAYYGLDAWTCTQLAELNGMPLVYSSNKENNSLYIATWNGLYILHSDGTLQNFTVPDEWRNGNMNPNSMVQKDGVLYLGMSLGILAYYPETETYDWYPLDFAREDK